MKCMIDGDDRIIFADGAWSLRPSRSGHGNDIWGVPGSGAAEGAESAPEGEGEQLLGRSFWSLAGSLEARQLLSLLVGRARAGARIEIEIDEQESDRGRLLICSPLSGYVVFEITGREQWRFLHLPATQDEVGERLEICSWCGLVKLDDARWVEIEEAVARLQIYQREVLPHLSHGICEGCYREVSGRGREMEQQQTRLPVV